MLAGIPREILSGERRVAATPETVAGLRQLGLEVAVEKGAGAGIFVSDAQYAAAGATIIDDARALFEQADLILKVKQPIFNEALGRHEAEMVRSDGTLITFLHPAAPGSHDMVRTLADRGVTSFSMDCIPRSPRAQTMDALTSMSTITGYRSVLIAAQLLPRFMPIMGTAIGVVKPAKVLIVGAGVVGLQSIATARRLGAAVSAIDIRPAARDEAKSLGATVVGFEVPEEVALGSGGYARALPERLLEEERALITPLLADADVVVLSALVPGEVAPTIVTRDMVASMKPGAVVVDVSIDQGGNCEVTEAGKTSAYGDVQVVGIQNIPGSMPVDASWLYANNILNYVTNLYKDGPGRIDWEDEIVRESLVTHQGRIVHQGTRKAMGLA